MLDPLCRCCTDCYTVSVHLMFCNIHFVLFLQCLLFSHPDFSPCLFGENASGRDYYGASKSIWTLKLHLKCMPLQQIAKYQTKRCFVTSVFVPTLNLRVHPSFTCSSLHNSLLNILASLMFSTTISSINTFYHV